MLKDIFFYPLVAILLFVIIGGALSLSDYETVSREDILAEGFTVEDQDLGILTAGPGTNFQYNPATSDVPSHARLFTTLARDAAPPSEGVFAVLSPNYEEAFAGHRLRLTITARSSAQNGLEDFEMAYFRSGKGFTGWKRKMLTDDWQDYMIEFSLGSLKAEADLNYISIWPGLTSEPLSMEVSRMRIEVLEKL